MKLRVVFGQQRGKDARVLAGVAAREVKTVRIERSDGTSADLKLGAPTIPAASRWFSSYEAPLAAAVVAYDATGNIAQRWRID
ncbi:hypothetical protein [Actinomadura alba]|uniref:Uncharacterized protein n=1 Tax=Actinomadura alba TaxID=406431 RepID=A0ABR7LK17_9ACTN|nr:hypothetical protein [Actinomadura alba]MBC6464845.1 hypothetical protein [Actinomadura alba]